MEYQEMVDALSKWGIDVSKFDRRSIKTLTQLHGEVTGREVQLFQAADGKVIRFARTAKVLASSATDQYFEVSRAYPRRSEVSSEISKIRMWTMSETLKREEDPRMAAVRGIREEFKIEIPPEALRYRAAPEELKTELSSVYAGIWSKTLGYLFEIDATLLGLTGDEHVVDDIGTTIVIKRFPFSRAVTPQDQINLAPYL